jgi:hypothetical protein
MMADKFDLNPKPLVAVSQDKEISKFNLDFHPMLQGVGSNGLIKIGAHGNLLVINAVTGEGKIKIDDFTAFIRDCGEDFKMRVRTQKLFHAFALELTKNNTYRGMGAANRFVAISLVDLMGLYGIPETKSSKDKFRARIKEDLDILRRMSVEWKESVGNREVAYAKMDIIYVHAISNGNIAVGFSPEFAEYLVNSYVMNFPIALLRLDERNPNSYCMAYQMALHCSMYANRVIGTENKLQVATLLKYCPTIPTIEEVKRGNRAVGMRIVEPFESSLDILRSSNYMQWEYCGGNDRALSQDELMDISYHKFAERYVRYCINGFPSAPIGIEEKKVELEALSQKKISSRENAGRPKKSKRQAD